jgi:hypothetical protein
MAARVTAIEVKAIMPGVSILDATVDLYIVAGSLLIDSVFGASNVDALTIQIEKWFIAHMIASTQNRMAIEEKLGDASVKYHDWKGEGLNSTPYGQMVILLDRLGLMANIGKKAASMYAVTSFEN